MAIEADQQLKSFGIKTIKYYYKNCPLIGNIFTSCVLMSEDQKILARGVAICSLVDSHNKTIARRLSLKRAKKAFFKKTNNDEINPNGPKAYMDVVKYFKIKDQETENEIVEKVNNLNFVYSERELNGSKRLDVFIPYFYPLDVTLEYFKFKSEYNPQPTDEEKKMFKIV
jgi:hypothetical protein